MKNNPQIKNFLDVGIRRFADRGIDGIKIDEICEDVGVAKSSFYHYFGSKKGFVDKLFEYWYDITHTSTIEEVKNINNARDRFLKLKETIDSNMDIEYFFLQLKLFALTNIKAQEVIEKTSLTRYNIVFEIFKMAGNSDKEADMNTRVWTMIYYGRVALMHGYAGSIDEIDIEEESILNILGLSK